LAQSFHQSFIIFHIPKQKFAIVKKAMHHFYSAETRRTAQSSNGQHFHKKKFENFLT
jgi:hypothetical protein